MGGRITRHLAATGYWAILLAAAAVPAVFTRTTAEAFMVPKVTLLWLCVLVSVVAAAGWSIAARRPPAPRMRALLPLAGLLAWTALATATSTSPRTSLVGQYGRYDGLLGLVVGIVLVVLVVGHTWRDPRRLDRLALAIVVGAVAGVGYVTVQQLGLDPIHWLTEEGLPIPNPYGLLGNSNFSGAHLGIAVPLVLALGRRTERPALRVAAWGLAGWFGLGILATGTRGGLLAAAGGTAAMGLLAPGLLPRAVRWGAVAATVVAAGLLVAAAAVNTIPGSDLRGAPKLFASDSLADRQDIWGAAAGMIAEHPLVGVGPDAFGLHFSDHVHPRAAEAAPLNADEAHDIFVDRAATAGLPAAALYLAFLGVVGTAAWRARRTVPDDQRWLLGGFGGAAVAYLLQGLVSIDVVPLAMTGWLALAALVSLADPWVVAAREAAGDAPTELRPLPLGVPVLGLAALAAATLVAIRPMAADARYRDAIEAVRDRRPRAIAAADLQAATDWNPIEPRYRSRLGDTLVAMASGEATDRQLAVELLEEARIAYRQALDLAPGDVGTLRAEARAERRLGVADEPDAEAHFQAADAIYGSLVRRVDRDSTLHVEFGDLLAEWADRSTGGEATRLQSRALVQYDQALALFPRSTAALSAMARIAVAQDRLADARDLLVRARRIRPGDQGIARLLAQVEQAMADR
jgi:O-antigen ligase